MEDATGLGASVVVVSPQTPAHSRTLIETHDLRFPILHDDGLRVAERFGLAHELPEDLRDVYAGFGIDLPSANGEDAWRLPMPARYVVDRTGTVAAAAVNADYTRRPEPDETLRALRELAG